MLERRPLMGMTVLFSWTNDFGIRSCPAIITHVLRKTEENKHAQFPNVEKHVCGTKCGVKYINKMEYQGGDDVD